MKSRFPVFTIWMMVLACALIGGVSTANAAWTIETKAFKDDDGVEWPDYCVAKSVVDDTYELYLAKNLDGDVRVGLKYPKKVFTDKDVQNRYPLKLFFDNSKATMRPVIVDSDAVVWEYDLLAVPFYQQNFDLLRLQMADRLQIEGMTQPMVFALKDWADTILRLDQCVVSAGIQKNEIALSIKQEQERQKMPELLRDILGKAGYGEFVLNNVAKDAQGEAYSWAYGQVSGAILLREIPHDEITFENFIQDYVWSYRDDCRQGLVHDIGTPYNKPSNEAVLLAKAEMACARGTAQQPQKWLLSLLFVEQDRKVVIFVTKSTELAGAVAIEARDKIADAIAK